MASSGPSPAVAAAIAASKASAPAETDTTATDALMKGAREARDLEMEIADLEERVKNKKAALAAMLGKTLVDLMVAAKQDKIGVPPIGNKPGYDFKMVADYSANIAAGWDDARREEGFEVVARLKGADMIKTEVNILFPQGGLKQAIALAKKMEKVKITATVGAGKKAKKVKQAVKADLHKWIPPQTLKAWLRDLYERGHMLSEVDLEKIGGYVGRKVQIEERKD